MSNDSKDEKTLFGIICRVEVAPDLPELTDEQGTQLYSIAQEAARNAVKQGKARQVEISVTHVPGRLIQTVRNDGQAWDVSQLPTNHLGVRIMHYRAGTIDGTLTLRAESDGRTTVVCQVPLTPAARSESPDPAPTLPNFLIHEQNPPPGGG
jgi:two-component system sensor histidine kinase UhpB